MKVKVLKKFRDAHTGEIHKKNDILDVNEARYTEIIKVDKTLVEEITEDEVKASKGTKAKKEK